MPIGKLWVFYAIQDFGNVSGNRRGRVRHRGTFSAFTATSYSLSFVYIFGFVVCGIERDRFEDKKAFLDRFCSFGSFLYLAVRSQSF